MAAVDSEPLAPDNKYADMQTIIDYNLPEGIFTDGIMHDVELVYLDIKLELFIKNNICHIPALSRGHHVRQHIERRIMHAPAREGSPASRAGDGAIFLSLVVVHCNRMNTVMIWTAGSLSEWWSKIGICSIPTHCIKHADNKIYIDSAHFLSWANSILEKRGGKRTLKRKSRKRKGRKSKKIKSVKKR